MATELQLDQMTIAEKLRAMEALWDDLCRYDAVEVPQWHKDILDERQRLIDEGNAEFLDWETVKKDLRDRLTGSPRREDRSMATEYQLDEMTLEQKLQLVDELWLSMAPELESLDVHQADRELLDDRWASFLEDPSSALTLEEFQQRMKALRA